jgi:hypothetical protein
MIGGLSGSLSSSLTGLPPVSSLFAAFLGINPIDHLLQIEGALGSLTAGSRALLTGKHFFPELIAAPFHDGRGGLVAARHRPRQSIVKGESE